MQWEVDEQIRLGNTSFLLGTEGRGSGLERLLCCAMCYCCCCSSVTERQEGVILAGSILAGLENINNPEFDNALKAVGMEKLMEIIIKAQTEKKTMLEIGSICCGIKEFQCLVSTGQGKGIAALVKSLFNSVRVWFSSVGSSEA